MRVRHSPQTMRALPKYQLAEIYARLRRAVTAGQIADAIALLQLAVPVDLPAVTGEAIALALHEQLQPALTYRGFKPAELAMLADDVKPVLKLEDLPVAEAQRFMERFHGQYRILPSETFTKDYLLMRTQPARSTDSAAMMNLYVSRGQQGADLQALERERPEACEESGALLGFPPCCTQAFAQDFRRSREDQDTVNDDATRRLVDQATPQNPGHAWLNPLSDLEPIGCYACTPHCENALNLANKSVKALENRRPDLLPLMQTWLTAPTLVWRLPFFLIFEGHAQGEGIAYTRVRANAFPDPLVRRVQALFAAALIPVLAQGNWLAVRENHLEIQKDGKIVHQLNLLGLPPALSAWHDGR